MAIISCSDIFVKSKMKKHLTRRCFTQKYRMEPAARGVRSRPRTDLASPVQHVPFFNLSQVDKPGSNASSGAPEDSAQLSGRTAFVEQLTQILVVSRCPFSSCFLRSAVVSHVCIRCRIQYGMQRTDNHRLIAAVLLGQDLPGDRIRSVRQGFQNLSCLFQFHFILLVRSRSEGCCCAPSARWNTS